MSGAGRQFSCTQVVLPDKTKPTPLTIGLALRNRICVPGGSSFLLFKPNHPVDHLVRTTRSTSVSSLAPSVSTRTSIPMSSVPPSSQPLPIIRAPATPSFTHMAPGPSRQTGTPTFPPTAGISPEIWPGIQQIRGGRPNQAIQTGGICREIQIHAKDSSSRTSSENKDAINHRKYDVLGDPDDHLNGFYTAGGVEGWTLPVWCHMFAQTLTGVARAWFDSLPVGEIDNLKDLISKFSQHFS
ncbi:hypothetical protein L1987_53217 [Smallanthus sonchifolius]|uniref:Uncharacterized protein n=1 Tax=Smallanthus sonchifolius TaxID=185202 RepID=A0ACB9EWG6_9ASTR|nr:hypothetical protein L1987_53217 [Smallanthus sonchifolius]